MDDKQIFLSTDLAHRLAAIDIGSNSVRLMVAEPLRGGAISHSRRRGVNRPDWGRTLNSTESLDAQAVELTLGRLAAVLSRLPVGYQV